MILWPLGESRPSILEGGPIRRCGARECVLAAGFVGNHRALRSKYDDGVVGCDEDLVVELFTEFGKSTPDQITGEFSFVLWDPQSQQLVAATDRAGSHPLYVSQDSAGTRLSFSFDRLLQHLERRSPDESSVAAHVCGGLIAPEATFYKGIRAVGPGSLLEMSATGRRDSKYWGLEMGPVLHLGSDREYEEALNELMLRVVEEYLPEDPFGVFLSGGLDSTSVAALARKIAPRARIHAVRATMSGLPKDDDGPLSARVVEFLSLQDLPVDGLSLAPALGPNDPLTDAAAPLQGITNRIHDAALGIAKAAGIHHILTGSGGDELFGSQVYSYPDLLLSGRWRQLHGEVSRHLAQSDVRLSTVVDRMILRAALGPFVGGLKRRFERPVPWLGERLRAHVPQAEKLHGRISTTLPGRLRRMQILSSWLIPSFNSNWKRLAGRSGIEVRHPLMDHRLREFAVRLPTTQTFRSGTNKRILRAAMAGELPVSVLGQVRKIVPRGFAHLELRERKPQRAWDLLSDMRSADMGFVDETRIRREYQAYLDGGHDDLTFWHTLTLEAWLRQHFR